jgi:hypothetical protein
MFSWLVLSISVVCFIAGMMNVLFSCCIYNLVSFYIWVKMMILPGDVKLSGGAIIRTLVFVCRPPAPSKQASHSQPPTVVPDYLDLSLD